MMFGWLCSRRNDLRDKKKNREKMREGRLETGVEIWGIALFLVSCVAIGEARTVSRTVRRGEWL